MRAIILSLLIWGSTIFTAASQDHLHRMLRATGSDAVLAETSYQLQSKTTQYLNSQSFIPATRVEHSYEGAHRIQTQRFIFDDSENDFVLNEQISRTFENGLLTEVIEQFVDSDNGTLVNSYRYQYFYESGGSSSLSEWISQYWDGDQWVNEERDLYEFNNGVPSVVTYQVWENNQWINYERSEIQQFSDNVTETTSSWDGSDWVGLSRMEFPGMSIESLYAYLLEFEQKFEDFEFVMLFTFFPDFNSYVWDSDLSEYVSELRQVTTVEEQNGQVTKRELHMQKFSEGDWIDSSLVTITYDDLGNEETLIFASSSFQTWIPLFRETYSYDENQNIILISQELNMGGSWEVTSETDLEWGTITAIDEDGEIVSDFRIGTAYPNPFNPEAIIPIELSQANQVRVTIYDLLGRQLQTIWDGRKSAGTHDIRFNASQLPSGIYIVQVVIDKQAINQRVTLLK